MGVWWSLPLRTPSGEGSLKTVGNGLLVAFREAKSSKTVPLETCFRRLYVKSTTCPLRLTVWGAFLLPLSQLQVQPCNVRTQRFFGVCTTNSCRRPLKG